MIQTLRSLYKTHRKRLLGMSIIFGIVILIITLVNQIILNIDEQIDTQTKPLVGADMVIESKQPLSGEIIQTINDNLKLYKAKTINYVQFYTTVGSENPKLAQVKGVQEGYPFYGAVEYDTINQGKSGALIDTETYELINKSDTIKLGEINVPVKGIIKNLPTTSINLFDEGRTIIIPYELVEKTQLATMGSRVEYQIWFKFENESDGAIFKQIIKNTFKEKYQVTLARDRVQQLGGIIEQLDQYISIILIITVILSLTMMATATMTMTLKIKKSIAIMRILGLTRGSIGIITTILYSSMFIVGGIIGIGGSFAAFQYVTTLPVAAGFIWSWKIWPIVVGVSMISFVIACREPIKLLVTTNPLLLLKSENQQSTNKQQILSSIIFLGGSWGILSLLTQNTLFSLITVLIGTTGIISGYYLIVGIFKIFHRYTKNIRISNFGLFDAIRQTIIPGNQTGLLVGGLTISLISFCVIIAISTSFLNRLRISSIDQPNIFVLNVRTQDVDLINKIDPKARLYDTILGRIEKINNKTLSEHLNDIKIGSGEDGQFTREFNITSIKLENSPVVQGVAIASGGVSLDQQFAKNLQVGIGDKIKLLIQGRSFDLTVTSLRKSIRTGSEPFFYMQLDSKQFEKAPRSRFRVSRQNEDQLINFKKNAIKEIGPHLSFIDIEAIIKLVTDISTKVIAIILICMSIIICLIIAVSIASNEASALVNQQSYWLYYMLGYTKSQLIRKTRFVVGMYMVVILGLLMIITPLILRIVYANASILTWSNQAILPISGGIGGTIFVMILTYRSFHKSMIQKLSNKQ